MKGWEIVAMATILVDSDDSMMFQMDSSWVSGHQSKAMGVPWMPIVGNGEQEQEVRELEDGLIAGERPESVESWFEKRGLVPPTYTSETVSYTHLTLPTTHGV